MDGRQRVPLHAALAGARAPASPGRTSLFRPCPRGRRRAFRADRRSRAPTRKSCSLKNARPLVVEQGAVRLDRVLDPLPGLQIPLARARPSGGRTPRPSASARRPATRPSPPGRRRAPRSAAARTPRAGRPPSGTGCPDRASPSTGRSSTSSRGCTPPRSASRADEKQPGRRRRSAACGPCLRHRLDLTIIATSGAGSLWRSGRPRRR